MSNKTSLEITKPQTAGSCMCRGMWTWVIDM